MILLCTSCNAFSRTLLHKAEAHDLGTHRRGRADPAMQGFRNGFQCAELIQRFRSLVEKATEWQIPMCISQIEFARVYDSIRHGPIQRSMLRRGAPASELAT